MANIKMYFKTRHKKREKIDEDAHAIYEIVNKYTDKCLYMAYSNSEIMFNVYKLDINQRAGLMADLCAQIYGTQKLVAVDLTYYAIT